MDSGNTPHNHREHNPSSQSENDVARDSEVGRNSHSSDLKGAQIRYERIEAQRFLEQQFHELVAHEFNRWSELRDQDVYRHIARVLVANIRQDYFDDAMRSVGDCKDRGDHRFPYAAHLSWLIGSCFELDQHCEDRRAIAELYSFLGDRVLFVKGMFHPAHIEYAVGLSATKLPFGVHNLADVAEMAYGRASELVADVEDEANAPRKSALFERLSRNVVDCIRGLQRVKMELEFQAYGLRADRPGLFLFEF